jgi:hypothetical protein
MPRILAGVFNVEIPALNAVNVLCCPGALGVIPAIGIMRGLPRLACVVIEDAGGQGVRRDHGYGVGDAA